MIKKLLVAITILTLLIPSTVLAQGGQPPAPGNADPMVVVAQAGGNVNVKSVLPPGVVITKTGSQSAQPIAQIAFNAPAVIGNQNIQGVQVVNKSDIAINTASMNKVGVVKYDVSNKLATGADAQELVANSPGMEVLLTQGAKSYVPSNTNIANNKAVVTQKVGEMTFNAYQTTDGKTVLVPDAYTAKLIQQTGINPLGAKADYTFLNGEAAKAANGGSLNDYGFKTEQVQQAAGGDPNAVTQYLQQVYSTANANTVRIQAEIEVRTPLQSLVYGTGPLAALLQAYKQTFDHEMTNADPNATYAANLLYAAQSAAQAGDFAQKNYVEFQYQKALKDSTIGKKYADLNTVMGMSANGDYYTADIDPTFWADLYLQMQAGALAQGNDAKQISMVFVYDKCPPSMPSCPQTTIKTPQPGTDPFAPAVGGGGVGDLEPILTAAGYGVQPLGICAARDWTIGQDDPSKPPYMNSGKTGPNNPVVINQDPTKRGVDISVNVVVPPVIVGYNATYVERINERLDPSNPAKTIWDRLIEECRRYTITIPDRVANVNVALDLSAESVTWITTDLALRYPGLRVYQGHWDVFPGLCAGGTYDDFRAFGCFAKSIPLKDPGYYILTINGLTTGTVVTAPRPIAYSDRFGVSALMVALIK